MIQKYLFLILALLSSTSLFPQAKDEDKDRNLVKQNRIQKTTQWTHKYSQGKPNPKGYITSETIYDKNGNPVEVINYKASGQVSSKLSYKFDQNNYKTEFVQYQKVNSPDLEVSFKQSFAYDEKGNKKIEVGFDGASPYQIIYTYFPDGRQKDVTKYNSDRSVSEKWEYSYTDDLITINVYKPSNKLDRKVLKKIDHSGNTIEETNLNAAGKELQKNISEYDESGKLTLLKEFYAGNPIKTLTYKYNPQNQLVEVNQTNPDGKKFLNHSYKYDGKGLLVEEKWFDGIPDDYSSKTYKYDSKSNVIEIESYYSDYKYKVLYKFSYEFY